MYQNWHSTLLPNEPIFNDAKRRKHVVHFIHMDLRQLVQVRLP